jgi:hypothetical protein
MEALQGKYRRPTAYRARKLGTFTSRLLFFRRRVSQNQSISDITQEKEKAPTDECPKGV